MTPTNKLEAEQLKSILSAEGSYSGQYRELMSVGDEIDGFKTVEEIEGENRRWSRSNTIITESPSGFFFMWFYEEGLTEMQEDEYFPEDVIEVAKVTKMIEKVSWEKIK